MFVREKAEMEDRALFEQIAGCRWNATYSRWSADRAQNIYIVDTGKRGVETPVIFHMYFQNHRIEFWIWEVEYRYKVIDVKIPSALQHAQTEIEQTIRRAYRETDGFTNLWSLPADIADHSFEFKII